MTSEIIVQPPERIHQQMAAFYADLGLIHLGERIKGKDIPPDVRDALTDLAIKISEMFSIEAPDLEATLMETVNAASRDLGVSFLLRERGYFRFWRMVRDRVWFNPRTEQVFLDNPNNSGFVFIPMFMTAINSDTEGYYATQEEFVTHICAEYGLSRATIFQRIKAIDRMVALGFTSDEAFDIILTRPYIIQDALKVFTDWDRDDKFIITSPELMRNTAKVFGTPEVEARITELVELKTPSEDEIEETYDLAKTLMRQMISGVARAETAKDARELINTDVLLQPEIRYRMAEGGILEITFIPKVRDLQTGQVHEEAPKVIPLVPDIAYEVPTEIVRDLMRRLPIINRKDQDNWAL